MRMSLARTASHVAIGVAMLALASCSVVPVPPSTLPDEWAESVSPSPVPSEQADSPFGFTYEERAAVRIRNVGCDGLGTGSGFILDSHTIVTNHHVVEDTGSLQVTLSDGTDVTVMKSVYATNVDFGILTIEEDLTPTVSLADHDPEPEDPITIVGYPNGDALEVSTGRVRAWIDDTLDHGERVVSTTAKTAPGSSGSAVYDAEGKIVGVLYAGNEDTDESYVIPVSLLQAVLADPSLQADNPVACTPDYL